MTNRKKLYYFLLTVFVLLYLGSEILLQICFYHYIADRDSDPNWRWIILSITFFTVIGYSFGWIVEMIVQPKNTLTKILLTWQISPLLIWINDENLGYAIVIAILTMIAFLSWIILSLIEWNGRIASTIK